MFENRKKKWHECVFKVSCEYEKNIAKSCKLFPSALLKNRRLRYFPVLKSNLNYGSNLLLTSLNWRQNSIKTKYFERFQKNYKDSSMKLNQFTSLLAWPFCHFFVITGQSSILQVFLSFPLHDRKNLLFLFIYMKAFFLFSEIK